MTKAVKKQVEIDFYTWEEVLVEANKHSPFKNERDNRMAFRFEQHTIIYAKEGYFETPNKTSPTGFLKFTPNDVLIKQIDGELYPCKKDIFEMTYDVISKEYE